MDSLQAVKASLRINHDKFDDTVIQPMIDACREDLAIQGVPPSLALGFSPLVTRAIVHYAHMNFPLEMPHTREIERHERAYQSIVHSLALGPKSTEELHWNPGRRG